MSPLVKCRHCGEPHPTYAASLVAECCDTMRLRALERRLLRIHLPTPEPVPALSTPHAGGEQ